MKWYSCTVNCKGLVKGKPNWIYLEIKARSIPQVRELLKLMLTNKCVVSEIKEI